MLLTAGSGEGWRAAAGALGGTTPLVVRSIGRRLDRNGAFAAAFGLQAGGAVLVRPDGVVAWRTAAMPADPSVALAGAVEMALGRRSGASRAAIPATGIGKEAA